MMKNPFPSVMILTALLSLSSCGVIFDANSPEVTLYLPERDSLSIDETDLTLWDSVRQQNLPIHVVYPYSSDKPNPVILFSYGYEGAGDQDKDLADYWTSHGYVVITPAHDDSSYKRPNSDYRGMDSEPLRTNRIDDIKLILDSLNSIEQDLPNYRGAFDKENVALAGFSFGAYVTTLMAGTTVTTPVGEVVNYQDSRLKAFLALSPQGRGAWTGFGDDAWDNLNTPIMFVTGSLDTQASLGAPNVGPEWRAEGYTFSPPGDKYYFCIEGFRHMDFDGSEDKRGKPFKAIYDSTHSVTLSFFDAYLRNSQSARDYLIFNSLAQETNSMVRLQAK